MELWDIYDAHRNLTGRTCVRGDALAAGDYHIGVGVWIRNALGQYLISRRTLNKSFGGLWESTSGAVLAGEDSLTAALREVREELGIALNPLNGMRICTFATEDTIVDLWLFWREVEMSDVVFRERETCDARWATLEEMDAMIDAGTFVPLKRGEIDLVRQASDDWEGEVRGALGRI